MVDQLLGGSLASVAYHNRSSTAGSIVCRYKSRLYSELGPNLWIIKMRAPLSSIEGEAASYATGTLPFSCLPLNHNTALWAASFCIICQRWQAVR